MRFCLSIGNLDKNIIYMIIGGVFRIFVDVLIIHKMNMLSSIMNHPLVMNFSSSLGLMLSLIPLIIYKIKNKEMTCCSKSTNTDLVYNDSMEQIKYGK